MIRQIAGDLKTNLANAYGWKTKRKIVVIESDDWGSIRVSSKNAYLKFDKAGIPVSGCPYNSNDALESNDDLEILFDALCSVKDKNNNHASITANSLVANPDFEKIKASNYNSYFFKTIKQTINEYPKSDRIIELSKEGIAKGIFKPQFHGREHIQINNWLNSLQKGDKSSLMAFEENMFSIARGQDTTCKKENLDAFGCYNTDDLINLKEAIIQGTQMFTELWGYQSKSVIAPCYIWGEEAENLFQETGIEYIQSGRVQTVPQTDHKPNIYKRHYTGQKNTRGQIYTIRNVIFEPSTEPNKDWINSCLKEMTMAFRWNKPAIISCHRVNFVGSINETNRTYNIELLKKLLFKIVQKWPDVEFMTSDELGEIIRKN